MRCPAEKRWFSPVSKVCCLNFVKGSYLCVMIVRVI
jgi:hypothetical protein